MKYLQLILDVAFLVLSVVTIVYVIAIWRKTPSVQEDSPANEWEEVV